MGEWERLLWSAGKWLDDHTMFKSERAAYVHGLKILAEATKAHEDNLAQHYKRDMGKNECLCKSPRKKRPWIERVADMGDV